MLSVHSREELQRRLATYLAKFGRDLDHESGEQAADLFTKESWTIGDKNMIKLLDTLVYLELEVSAGERLASCGKQRVVEMFNLRFYADHFVKRIKPVQRGTRAGKVNDYAASAYVQHGFNQIALLQDRNQVARCLRRYRAVNDRSAFVDVFTTAAEVINVNRYASLADAVQATKVSFFTLKR